MPETERLVAEIPPSLKYLVDDDDRSNKDVVVAALERELGVNSSDSVAVIERKIKRQERRLEEVQETAREHADRAGEIKNDLDELREIKDEKISNEGSYEDALDELLDRLEADEIKHLEPLHPDLDDLRGEFGISNEEIHYDLKQRAADQDRELMNTRFMKLSRARSKRRSGKEMYIAEAVEEGSE